MNILLTGGAGYTGSHAAVVLLDNCLHPKDLFKDNCSLSLMFIILRWIKHINCSTGKLNEISQEFFLLPEIGKDKEMIDFIGKI